MGFGVWGLGFGVSGLGFRVSGFWIWGSGFGVRGLGLLGCSSQAHGDAQGQLTFWSSRSTTWHSMQRPFLSQTCFGSKGRLGFRV